MFDKVNAIISCIDFSTIDESRKQELRQLTNYVQMRVQRNLPVQLNFICTHNSRRSQFSQLWSAVAADYYGHKIDSFSGGIAITSCNERTIKSLSRFGFQVLGEGGDNPLYNVSWRQNGAPTKLYSKLYNAPENPRTDFAAIMTCDHADQNCPIVEGCEKRIAIRYKDPKKYDETPLEDTMYDCRSFQIASEMFYAFSEVEK